MEEFSGFMKSIGRCNLNQNALGFTTAKDSVDLAVSSFATMPGVNIHLQQFMGEMKLNGCVIIYLNEEQLLQISELLNMAIRVNAYGKGIAEMGGM